MLDRSSGFILSTKTKEIDPVSNMGEFGVDHKDDLSDTTKNKPKRRKKKGGTTISHVIMACAYAMSQGMSRPASSVSKMGNQMRTDPTLIEGGGGS